MHGKSSESGAGRRGRWNRRSLLIGFLSLSAWLSLKKSGPAKSDAGKAVLAGGWILKKSDLT